MDFSTIRKRMMAAAFVAGLSASVVFAADPVQEPPAGAKEAVKQMKAQTFCPVMGGKIDTTSFLDHEGKRIYFCCDACKEPFKKNPTKYLKKIKKRGEAPELLTL